MATLLLKILSFLHVPSGVLNEILDPTRATSARPRKLVSIGDVLHKLLSCFAAGEEQVRLRQSACALRDAPLGQVVRPKISLAPSDYECYARMQGVGPLRKCARLW